MPDDIAFYYSVCAKLRNMEDDMTIARLQCPRCGRFLEKSRETYLCPNGHVEVSTTPEGYPILKESGASGKQLLYGGDFKEGVIWQKAISHCKKVIYLASSEDKEDEPKPLRDYLTALMREFKVIYSDRLSKLKIDRETLIVFSPRIGRENILKILLKCLRHPVYRYVHHSVIRMGLAKLVRQVLGASLYKLFLSPIISRRIEACYERYLFDERTAEHFALTHLPQEMQNGKGLRAFDIGCGRGRHAAMLSQLGFGVTGMDLQTYPYWRRIPEATFIVGSTECLPYVPDTSFDFIACMQVLMYVADDDAVLAHMRRMLKQVGYLLLQVTNAENLHTVFTNEPLTQDPYLRRYYKHSELCNKLEQHGFRIGRVWTEKFYPPFFVLPGNILYDLVLNDPLRVSWDRLVHPRYLGLINILARPS